MMTVTFVDVMIIDVDTFSFLLTMIPGLAWKVALAVLLAGPVLVLLWRLEPFRVRRGLAVVGAALSLRRSPRSRSRCRPTARTSSTTTTTSPSSRARARSPPST